MSEATAARKRKAERIAAQRMIDKNRGLAKADWVRTPRASVIHAAKLIVHYSAEVDRLIADVEQAEAQLAEAVGHVQALKMGGMEAQKQERIRAATDFLASLEKHE